jgi:hypothetical protein
MRASGGILPVRFRNGTRRGRLGGGWRSACGSGLTAVMVWGHAETRPVAPGPAPGQWPGHVLSPGLGCRYFNVSQFLSLIPGSCMQNVQAVRPDMKSDQRIGIMDQLITPELAKYWLDNCNTRNRRHKLDKSDLYASDMKHGRWTRGTRIGFYTDGVLCDGQNRLLAVCKSGIPCYFDVVVGMTQEQGANIDTGVKRSVSDSLQIKGTADWIATKECVAIVNALNKAQSNRKSLQLSHYVIEKFAVNNEDLIRPFCDLSRGSRKRKVTNSLYYAVLISAVYSGCSFDEIKDFNNRYISGENYDPSKNASTRLREYVLEFPGSPWHLPIGLDTAKRAQRALKAFMSRQSLSKLYSPSEWIYEFPVVDDCTNG